MMKPPPLQSGFNPQPGGIQRPAPPATNSKEAIQPTNETASSATTRALGGKIPQFTLTTDEIRLSKAAEREVLASRQLPPWDPKNKLMPF